MKRVNNNRIDYRWYWGFLEDKKTLFFYIDAKNAVIMLEGKWVIREL